MFCLINVYDDILQDFEKDIYKQSEVLYRTLTLNDNKKVVLSVFRHSKVAKVDFSISMYTPDILKKLPKWKGMEENIIADSSRANRVFLSFTQSIDYDVKIFFVIMQDLLEHFQNATSSEAVKVIKAALERWSVFFQFEKEYVLSDRAQQGLYGELYVLKQIVQLYGEKALSCWTGYSGETHDFYFGSEALEVKCSGIKGANQVHISNEYQLDNNELVGKLCLMHLRVQKSEAYGETLPELVLDISNLLSETGKTIFKDKLLQAGYIYQLPELYHIHFSIYEESCYQIEEEFPKITVNMLPKGVKSVEYIVNLDICERFQLSVESYYKEVPL